MAASGLKRKQTSIYFWIYLSALPAFSIDYNGIMFVAFECVAAYNAH